jgi:hypothetical protein
MDDDGQPSWLSSNSSRPKEGDAAQPAASTGAASTKPPYYGVVSWTCTIINMGLMFFMAFTGAVGTLSSDNVDDTGVIFVGIYLMIFAAIEFMYELSQIVKITSFDNLMKKNFGFLYGVNGRGLYFLFVGVLCFGLKSPRDLAIGCGVAVAFWGPFLIVVSIIKPDYFPKMQKYVPP